MAEKAKETRSGWLLHIVQHIYNSHPKKINGTNQFT